MWSFISVPGTCQTGKNIVWNLWWFFSFFSISFSVILWRAGINLSKLLIYIDDFEVILSLVLNLTHVPGTCFLKKTIAVFLCCFHGSCWNFYTQISDVFKRWNQKYYVFTQKTNTLLNWKLFLSQGHTLKSMSLGQILRFFLKFNLSYNF